ncbi:MAG: undecaprenyl/decaprenyl-phosphate alpha-N-acetylglucosaminyl 1-phosphate transferase [Oscillospiraceae bacterium]|nr:undecaprenyl/decaprenyl-phosphate alpha-N-acetylglucosaminyl 1-phosphate transferase [Oscillospiraceae bacterium]
MNDLLTPIDPEFFIRIVFAVFAAAMVSFAATPPVILLAKRVGAIDDPRRDSGRRMHKTPTPRLGGLAVFFAFAVTVWFFSAEITTELRGILIGSVIIVALGCVDDIVGLPYWLKLFFQLAAAFVAVFHNLIIKAFSNPLPFGPDLLNLGAFALPVTIIWIMALTNAVNFIDGLDGLACGISVIGSVSLLVISLVTNEGVVALIMAALLGGCLGFLPFNFNPARIFIGDTGATFLGFVLACVSVQGLFKAYTLITFAAPFLILGLPIIDIVVSVARRLISGKNPAHADKKHIHHRLIDLGFSQKQAVALLYAISAALGLTAVLLTTSGPLRAFIMLAAIAVACAVYFVMLILQARARKRHNAAGKGDGANGAD